VNIRLVLAKLLCPKGHEVVDVASPKAEQIQQLRQLEKKALATVRRARAVTAAQERVRAGRDPQA